MPLVNQQIKNFVAGVSQQPAYLRYPEQLEEQINGFSTEAAGLQKRPPTLHKFRMGIPVGDIKPKCHFINRDSSEQYAVVFTGSDIVVYDILSGERKSVTFENAEDKAYITTNKPRSVLKTTTIADYTFVANMDIPTKMRSEIAPDLWATQGILINVKSGQYGRTYKVVVDGTSIGEFQTPDGSQASHINQINTDYIVEQLASKITTNGWTVTKGTSWLYLTGKTYNKVEVFDGYNNQAMVCIVKTTQKFTNLPAVAPDGFTVKIVGEKGSLSDDYYVRYDSKEQIWKETIQPGLKLGFDKSTMPHTLVRQADGTFLFRKGEWSDRETGDEDSNPEPSFIGYPINDVFFFRNRLGFLSGENIILSSNADFFRFWMASAISVGDTDTIDIAVSDNKISTLYQAVPHGEDLIIFSGETQFALRADGVLSPSNVKVDSLTYFSSDIRVKPVGAGRNIYFTAQRTDYSSVKEYFTAFDNTDKRDAQDITAHTPNYIPNGVYQLVSSTIDNVILFLTEGDPNKIYVYKYLYIDGVKQQSAWSVWDFEAEIVGASFIGASLYLIFRREDSYCLEKLSISYNTKDFDNEPYRYYIDRKVETPVLTSGKYDDVRNKFTINLNDYYGGDTLDEGVYAICTPKGVTYLTSSPIVELVGDFTGQKLIIGRIFKFKVVFSTFMIKQQAQDGGAISVVDGRLQLHHITINYVNSGYYKVIVNDKEYIQSMYSFNTGDKLGVCNFKTGVLKVPVQTQNTKARISIESDLPTPVAFVGGSWEGRYNKRYNNIG